MKELRDRNQKIYVDRLKGGTYRELGIKYNLSLDRVYKIVDRERLREKHGRNWLDFFKQRKKLNRRRTSEIE